jgi:hypothetical protein
MPQRRERSYYTTRRSFFLMVRAEPDLFNIIANHDIGDKWEPEIAASARADAPYR